MKLAYPTALAALAAAAGVAVPASAQSWRLASSTRIAAHYVDISSIRRSGVLVQFSYEVRPRTVQRLATGQEWDLGRNRVEADCANMTFRILQAVIRRRGQDVGPPSAPETQPTAAEPQSIMGGVIRTACSAR